MTPSSTNITDPEFIASLGLENKDLDGALAGTDAGGLESGDDASVGGGHQPANEWREHSVGEWRRANGPDGAKYAGLLRSARVRVKSGQN